MLQPTPTTKTRTQLIYDAVSQKYDVGSFEEFESKLENPQSRQLFYEAVSNQYGLGSYEEIDDKLSEHYQ